MSRRRLLLMLLGCAAVGCAALALMPGDPISPANFEKIQLGMTLQEVEVILGRRSAISQPPRVRSRVSVRGIRG